MNLPSNAISIGKNYHSELSYCRITYDLKGFSPFTEVIKRADRVVLISEMHKKLIHIHSVKKIIHHRDNGSSYYEIELSKVKEPIRADKVLKYSRWELL